MSQFAFGYSCAHIFCHLKRQFLHSITISDKRPACNIYNEIATRWHHLTCRLRCPAFLAFVRFLWIVDLHSLWSLMFSVKKYIEKSSLINFDFFFSLCPWSTPSASVYVHIISLIIVILLLIILFVQHKYHQFPFKEIPKSWCWFDSWLHGKVQGQNQRSIIISRSKCCSVLTYA